MAQAPAGQTNIGTPEAPLWVPTGSPGHLNYQQNVAPNVAAGVLNPTGTAPMSPVTTSDPARDAYSSLLDQITKLNQAPPAVNVSYGGQTFSNTSDLVGAQRASLEQRRAAEIARINSEFEQAKLGQQQAQRGEVGTSSMGLARIGGFDSASGQAVLTNLERVHVQEQQALMSARQQALQQAQNAYDDKDFALAQLQIDEARKAEQLIYDRSQDFIRNTLAIKGEQRADLSQQLEQTRFDYQKRRDDKQDAQNALEFSMTYGIDKPFFVVGGVGYDTSNGDKLSYEDFISRGGKPDFSNATIITPGSLEDKAFVQKLRDTYPDAGISSSDTAEQAQAKIKNSRIYRKETYIAPVGGAATQKTAAQSDVITRARAALQGEADVSQNHMSNPTTYRNFMSEYVQKGGSPSDFYAAVSLDQYIADHDRKGDLAGSSIQYQQIKNDPTQEQARLQELLNKSDQGNDLGKLNFQELAEFRKLLGM